MEYLLMRNDKLQVGLILVDNQLKLLRFNSEAVKILAYPTVPERIKRMDIFLSDRVKSGLIAEHSPESPTFSKEFRSGNRRYTCRTFALEPQETDSFRQATMLLLERNPFRVSALSQASEMFGFTPRENQTVELLLQGLTSKEIATRLEISPNTVKAFVRLVMVKMGVTTRSGIVGKIFLSPA
jgi:DNA-binding CsgD family transcriptional regulator